MNNAVIRLLLSIEKRNEYGINYSEVHSWPVCR